MKKYCVQCLVENIVLTELKLAHVYGYETLECERHGACATNYYLSPSDANSICKNKVKNLQKIIDKIVIVD